MPTIVIELDSLRTLRDLHAERAGAIGQVNQQVRQLRNELDLNVDAPQAGRIVRQVEEATAMLARQETVLRRLAQELATYVSRVDGADNLPASSGLGSLFGGWLGRPLRQARRLLPSLEALRAQLGELRVTVGPIEQIVANSMNGIVLGSAGGTRATVRQNAALDKGFGGKLRQAKRFTDDKIHATRDWVGDRAGDVERVVDSAWDRGTAEFDAIWDDAQRVFQRTVAGLAWIRSFATTFIDNSLQTIGRKGSTFARRVGRSLQELDAKSLMLKEAYSHRFGSAAASNPNGKSENLDGTVDIDIAGPPPLRFELKGSATVVHLESGDIEITIDGFGAGGLVAHSDAGGNSESGGSGSLEAALLVGIGRGATYRISGAPVNGRPAQAVFLEQQLLRLWLLGEFLSGTPPFVVDQALRRMAPLPAAIRTEIYDKVVLDAEIACSMFGVRTAGAAAVEVAATTTYDQERSQTRRELSVVLDADGQLMLPTETLPILSYGPGAVVKGKAFVACVVDTNGSLQSVEIGLVGLVGFGGGNDLNFDVGVASVEAKLQSGPAKTFDHRKVVDVSMMSEADRQRISELARAAMTDPRKLDEFAKTVTSMADRYGHEIMDDGEVQMTQGTVKIDAAVKEVGVGFEGVVTVIEKLPKP